MIADASKTRLAVAHAKYAMLRSQNPAGFNPRSTDGHLIAANGYYVLVAMTVSVDRTPMPGGARLPLPMLKK